MSRLKFDTTINAGHILIVAGMAISVFLAYSDLLRSIDRHEIRIGTIERQTDSNADIQRQILQTLTTIREDIATLKAQTRRDSNTDPFSR
ncbi:hypothetical protein [Mesorhizobium sp. Z1-4]|uniref:hypothetical protein n=1 Tax=Mesorhizobium sp. Z1-4 TaxID=2448478 RepID=UPI000FD7A838|nr:hypothetical protein [Mesorhizobium sp. Z1-4]